MDIETCKKNAALAATTLIEDKMAIGLGSGTTIRYFIEAIAARIQKGLQITCAPSSKNTRIFAQKLNIPLFDDENIPPLDLAVDGADEINAHCHAVKGGGGALLREKIIVNAAKYVAIIIDETKYVTKLGAFPLPVEISPFAYETTKIQLIKCVGSQYDISLRKKQNTPILTDNGNMVYDCAFKTIHDPIRLAYQLDAIAGVMAHGLFIDNIDEIFIAKKNGHIIRHKNTNKINGSIS